jgi:hypothetical protein
VAELTCCFTRCTSMSIATAGQHCTRLASKTVALHFEPAVGAWAVPELSALEVTTQLVWCIQLLLEWSSVARLSTVLAALELRAA